LLAGMCVGCGDKAPIFISTNEEIKMGEQAAPQFEEEFEGRVASEELQNYMQMVGQKMAAASGRDVPYEYAVLNSDVPNAFALPGGKIYITAGLMKAMTNERQLAAVLGHETAHVHERHNVRMIQQQMGGAVLAEVIGSVAGEYGGMAEAATKIVVSMQNLRYSRDNEYEADAVGMRFMADSGYDPWGMVELLTVLHDMHEKQPGRFEEMFLTHPLTSKRIEEAQGGIEENFEQASPGAPDPYVNRFLRNKQRLLDALP